MMSRQLSEKSNEQCRGFECVGYKNESNPNNKGDYRGCKIRNINMTLLSEPLCEECEYITDCRYCIHSQTCKDSLAKEDLI